MTYNNHSNPPPAVSHKHHSSEDSILFRPDADGVHSTMMPDDGRQIHEHEFRVHTGHDISLGHSDAPHHEIFPPDPKVGRYETESEHASFQAHPERVSHKQFGREGVASLPFGITEKPAGYVRRRPPITSETWGCMAAALRVLRDRGYDSSEADYFLPMIESGYIHPDAEAALYHFYSHVLKRISPEWASSEPVDIVSACRQFISGYEEVKDIVH